LVAQTRSLGLSLGDRACLALGARFDSARVHGRQVMEGLKVGIRIHANPIERVLASP